MAGGFSFPPPPPPPRPASGPDQGYSQYGSQQSGRGGRGRGTYEARGHGESYGRGGQNFRGRGNANMTPLNPNGHARGGGQRPPSSQDPRPSAFQQSANLTPSLQGGSAFPPGAHVNPNFAMQSRQPSNAAFSQGPENGTAHTNGSDYQVPRMDQGQRHSRPFAHDTGPSRTTAGHKRKLEALRGPQEPRENKPDQPAAPSVPSFGASVLPTPIHTSIDHQSKGHLPRSTAQKPPGKSIGLTPRNNDVEPDELSDSGGEDNDLDEEAQFAELGTKLTFEHNGEVLSLNNEADLAMWREERRKKWPTLNRVAEREDDRRRTGQERKRLLAAVSLIHRPPRARNPDPRERQKIEGTRSTAVYETSASTPAGNRAQTAAPIRQEATNVEESPAVHQSESPGRTFHSEAGVQEPVNDPPGSELPPESLHTGHDTGDAHQRFPPGLPGIDMNETDDEDVSMNDAADHELEPSRRSSVPSVSDSGDEGPPEQSSTKQLEIPASHSQKPVCRYFSASGRCRDGDMCRFRHELSSKAPMSSSQAQQYQPPKQPYDRFAPKLDQPMNAGRKSIHERLVEQEQLEEDRLTLKAIKALGEAGFFRVPIADAQ